MEAKSSTKIEEKFKRYISQADMLMHTLSEVSEMAIIPEDDCDSAHLLYKNTESFRCLTQLLISSSSLTRNRLFLFPPLEDPGIELAFNFKEPKPENDDVGIEKYKKLCKDMEIVPITRIIKSLETDTLNLKYYGLTFKQIKALTEAMKANAHVENLILQDNWLTLDMTSLISDMVVENTSLQYLSLQECRIGEEGAGKLGEVLSSLQTLKSLNLSFNDIGDKGLVALKDGLCNNASLKTLNISHNNLTEESGETMETILLENKHVEELDLSWNGFYTAIGNRKLFNGLLRSDRIQFLNIAWNGIGITPAVRPITKYLRNSKNLKEINLSNNRLVGQSLRMTRGAINKNKSLETVRIGNNIYPPEEAHLLLSALAGKSKDPLNYLDMENMYINKGSKPLLTKIKNIGKRVKIGGILSDYEIIGPNPRKLIYERCRFILKKPKRAKAKKDFGHFILSLPETPLTPDEFQKLLKKQKVKKLDKELVQGLMNLFVNKKNQIECVDLVKDYMTFYPETCLPPPKPKKSKKGKKKGKKKEEEKDHRKTIKILVSKKVEEPQKEQEVSVIPVIDSINQIVETAEQEIQVHDLESAPETEPSNQQQVQFTPEVKRESQTPERKSMAANRSSKSVTIMAQPSILGEMDQTKVTSVPSKSIIKMQE